MYEEYFGFSGKPFALTPDSRFFYPSRAHARAMSYLEYGVQCAEGFIVVSGEVGAGKTTVVQGLLHSLTGKPIVAAQIVSSQLGGFELLQAVAAAFGISYGDWPKARLIDEIGRFLMAVRSSGRRALLVVDEAQNLDKSALEELRMLSNLQDGARPLLQSFLVGQPELKEILRSADMLQLQQRIIAAYHLGPLDLQDTKNYIQHRLNVVGWAERPRIDDETYEEVYRRTGGIPRLINVFFDRMLLVGFLEERSALTRETALAVADDIADEGGSNPQLMAAGSSKVVDENVPSLNEDVALRQLDVLESLQRVISQGGRIERYVISAFRGVRELVDVQRTKDVSGRRGEDCSEGKEWAQRGRRE